MRTYYLLTKPGIIFGNLLATAAGFLLASAGNVDFWLYLETLLGLALVIASACVFNNYIDRHLDKKMSRTKDRALASGSISGSKAIFFASVLGLTGVTILGIFTNWVATLVAIIGFVTYVVVYSVAKRRSEYGTLVGSISGAVPPVVGYCAVSAGVDAGAIILFLVLVFWQMPHFYAIGIYKRDDYEMAGIPVLPVRKGVHTAKVHILIYIFAFLFAVLLLMLYGYTGLSYLLVVGGAGLYWLWQSIKGFESDNSRKDRRWARKMFRVSLVVLVLFCVMVGLEGAMS